MGNIESGVFRPASENTGPVDWAGFGLLCSNIYRDGVPILAEI
jgi:hypothetical protein